jgi:hypothetical protein
VNRDTELARALALADGADRTAALVAWVQGLFEAEEGPIPILVGGAAVELYTGGAYTTGDLDFVGDVSRGVARALEAAGFTRQGRHWVHHEGEVFLEFPASHLDEGERADYLEVGGRRILVLGPEELIADRLAAWEHWGSEVDAVNAFLLWRGTGEQLDLERLRGLAKHHQVETSLESLQAFVAETAGRTPSDEEIRQWATHES